MTYSLGENRLNTKLFKYIKACMMVVVCFFLSYTIIVKNGNSNYNYCTKNDSLESYVLSAGECYEEIILANSDDMSLQKLWIELNDVSMSDSDQFHISLGDIDYVYNLDELNDSKVIELYFSGEDANIDLFLELCGKTNSRISLVRSTQTQGIYVGKEYSVNQLERHSFLFYFMSTLLVVAILFEVIVICFYPNLMNDSFHQLVTALIIFLLISLRDITLVVNPQEFAEQIGTGFYWGTNAGFVEALTTTEAGYCAMGYRLISWLVCRTQIGRIHFVEITNFILVSYIALCCSMIMKLRLFKARSSINRAITFLTALYVPMIALSFNSNFLFIDIGYWGFIIIICIWLQGSEYTRKWYAYTFDFVIVGLSCLTKGYFVVLIPAAIVHFVMSKTKTRLNDIAIVVGGLFQLAISISGNAVSMWSNKNTVIQFIKCGFKELGKVSFRVWGIVPKTKVAGYFGVVECFMLLAVFCVLWVRWRKAEEEETLVNMLIIGLIFCEIVFFLITLSAYSVDDYQKIRYEMFLIVTTIFFYLRMLGVVLNEKGAFVCISILMLLGITDEYRIDYYNAGHVTTRICDWEAVSKHIEENVYFIKLDPSDWKYRNYNERASEKVCDALPTALFEERLDVLAVYAMNRDLSRDIALRLYFEDGNIMEVKKTSSDIKEYMTFYLDAPVKGVERVEFFDYDSKENIYIKDVCVCYLDDDYKFILRP